MQRPREKNRLGALEEVKMTNLAEHREGNDKRWSKGF